MRRLPSTRRRRWTKLVIVLAAASIIAAACGGESEDETTPKQSATTAGGPVTTAAPKEIYNDPRGGVYAEFQKTFDRAGDPFSSVTEFCKKHDAAKELKDVEAGITKDKIVMAHIRTKLEDLAAFGFDVFVGNTKDMFEVFNKVINEQCGGIRGRKVELATVEVIALGGGGLDIDAERNKACVTATEDRKASIVVNTSGFQGTGILCIVQDHKAIYLSTTNGSAEFLSKSGGRMFGVAPVLDDYNIALANEVIRSGIAKGKVIGVIDADTPGQPEGNKKFIDILEKNGLKVTTYQTLQCKGSSSCTGGMVEAVQKAIRDKVDFMYPNLNVVTLPQFMKEMVTQGVKPGQIQFINSNFNSQAGDLVSSKIPENGGPEAGALYNGAIMFDPAPTGNYRTTDDPTPFMKMCNETYQKNSTLPDKGEYVYAKAGKTFKFKDDVEVSPFGMVGSVCLITRIISRAIYRAGDNPTRDDIQKALSNLGPVDLTYQIPGTFTPGKSGAPDFGFQLKFNYPCPGGTTMKGGSCITQTGGPFPLNLKA